MANSSPAATFEFPFDMLSQFASAQAIFAAFEVGIWERFEKDLDGTLDPGAYASERGLEPTMTRGVVEYLTRRGYFEAVPGGGASVKLSPLGRRLVGEDWLGYFVFLVGGYGEVLRAGGSMMLKKKAYGPDIRRDGKYVALGSELQGRHPKHGSFATLLETVNAGPKPGTILDIGCGSGKFLYKLMSAVGAQNGVGIDIDAPACELARDNAKELGLGDRVRIFCGDASAPLKVDPSLEGVADLTTAMFVVHEFFGQGQERAAQLLREVARTLKPGTGRFLIMDKQTDVLMEGEAPPYFTEFKLLHDLTKQTLVTSKYWAEIFAAAELEVLSTKPLGKLSGTVQFVCRRKGS